MPSILTPKLSNIALEYLRNHDELEAARELFLGERNKLLDGFGSIMGEAARELRQVVTESARSDKYGTFDLYIMGNYVALRAKAGKKRSSGCSAGLGSFLGHVGAQTMLWFHLTLNPARHGRLEISALEKALGADVRTIGEGSWLYLRTAAWSASNLDLEAFEGEVRRLPELFATADAWIAQRFGG